MFTAIAKPLYWWETAYTLQRRIDETYARQIEIAVIANKGGFIPWGREKNNESPLGFLINSLYLAVGQQVIINLLACRQIIVNLVVVEQLFIYLVADRQLIIYLI